MSQIQAKFQNMQDMLLWLLL